MTCDDEVDIDELAELLEVDCIEDEVEGAIAEEEDVEGAEEETEELVADILLERLDDEVPIELADDVCVDEIEDDEPDVPRDEDEVEGAMEVLLELVIMLDVVETEAAELVERLEDDDTLLLLALAELIWTIPTTLPGLPEVTV